MPETKSSGSKNTASYYSMFYFGGTLAADSGEYSMAKVSDDSELGGSHDDNDDEVMFGKDRRPSLLSRNLRPEVFEGEMRPSLSVADLPPFKKSMKCYIDGCKKTFTFGGRSHCRHCGNSVCNKHVSATKVPMDLFGYANAEGERLFEKVCVECYDDVMAKSVKGGQLSTGRLLCYLMFFRDRTRYLRIKRGLKAVRKLQAIIRGDLCRIDLTWRNAGLEDVVTFMMQEHRDQKLRDDKLLMHSEQSNLMGHVLPATYEDKMLMTHSEDRQDSIPMEMQTDADAPRTSVYGDDVPNPDNTDFETVSTQQVNRAYFVKPILPSQMDTTRRKSWKVVDKKKKRQSKEESDWETGNSSASDSAATVASCSGTDPIHNVSPMRGSSARPIPGAERPPEEDEHGEQVLAGPPGRVRGASLPPGSLPVQLTDQDEDNDQNAALSEAQEILRKQNSSFTGSYERKMLSGLAQGSGQSLASNGSAEFDDGGKNVSIGLSPAALLTLSHSPAGVSALKDYVVGGNEVKLAVTSPNTRQHRTDEENYAEEENINSLLELKKEAQQRMQHQRYVKKLEDQAKAEAEARRLAVKEARAKRLQAEAETEVQISAEVSNSGDTTSIASHPSPTMPPTANTIPNAEAMKLVTTISSSDGGVSELLKSSRNESSDSADEEEEKERARLADAERKRKQALELLPGRASEATLSLQSPVVPASNEE